LQAHQLQVESLAALESLLGSFRLLASTAKPVTAPTRPAREGRQNGTDHEVREPGCTILLQVEKAGPRGLVRGTLSLGKQWRVQPDDELLSRLRERFGSASVALNYQ
ncbi:MAG TPA: hypothetical protein VMH83_03795, partial [Candidatus Acidoferrum sp.]|nr:hypothetical protein [Candidatus Acidoferrum sp.]